VSITASKFKNPQEKCSSGTHKRKKRGFLRKKKTIKRERPHARSLAGIRGGRNSLTDKRRSQRASLAREGVDHESNALPWGALQKKLPANLKRGCARDGGGWGPADR